MSAPKNPRVTITPEAHHALNIQAAIEQISPGLLASRLILAYSKKAKQALQEQALQEREAPLEEGSLNPSEGGSQAPPEGERDRGSREEREAPSEGRKKRPRLFQNPQALQDIKRLWEGGQRNQAEISRVIGYDRATVNDNIRKMIKAGELSPKDQ